MEFQLRRVAASRSLAVFPGAWNPPTLAHHAMALGALDHVEEVILTLPLAMPHKLLPDSEVRKRLAWLHALAASDPRLSVAVTRQGLLSGIARDARDTTGASRVAVLCGRDAAERALSWDYGGGPGFVQQMEEFDLLVAPRNGPFDAPESLRSRVTHIELDEALQRLSSTEARIRIECGLGVETIVPPAILPSRR